jgi:hypothetical protein
MSQEVYGISAAAGSTRRRLNLTGITVWQVQLGPRCLGALKPTPALAAAVLGPEATAFRENFRQRALPF